MALSVVALDQNPNQGEAIDTVEALRADIIAGKVSAFAVAAVGSGDEVVIYVSSTRGVTRLRLIGAMSQFLHDYMAGKV
jgi:hypothetical protein